MHFFLRNLIAHKQRVEATAFNDAVVDAFFYNKKRGRKRFPTSYFHTRYYFFVFLPHEYFSGQYPKYSHFGIITISITVFHSSE